MWFLEREIEENKMIDDVRDDPSTVQTRRIAPNNALLFGNTTGQRRAVVPVTPDDEIENDDSFYTQRSRMPRSNVRMRDVVEADTTRTRLPVPLEPNVKRRRAGKQISVPVQKQKTGKRLHTLFLLGLGMLLMCPVVWGFFTLHSWWGRHMDDVTYGFPRTYQTDAVVGHNGDDITKESHFLAENLNGRVVVIEFPASDPSKVIVYNGPVLYGQDANLAAITLTFKDMNGDGKVDMVVSVEGQPDPIVYLNDGTRFVKPQGS